MRVAVNNKANKINGFFMIKSLQDGCLCSTVLKSQSSVDLV
ncbi:hypothetical protein [Moraxella lacunata]